jgi:peptide/nickel transport system permease protein
VAGFEPAASSSRTIGSLKVRTLPRSSDRTVRPLTSGDLPVIMAVVLVAAFFVVIANLAVDVGYSFLDPGVRLT